MNTPSVKMSRQTARKTAEAIRWIERQRVNLIGEDSDTQPHEVQFFTAVIVASSFTDSRYTVERAYPSNDAEGATDDVEWTPFASGHPMALSVTARNTAENGSHRLPENNEPVIVFYEWDRTTDPDPQPRYWFTRPVAMTDMRWNDALGTMQVTYSNKHPASLVDSDWTNKITFSPRTCPTS